MALTRTGKGNSSAYNLPAYIHKMLHNIYMEKKQTKNKTNKKQKTKQKTKKQQLCILYETVQSSI